MWKPLPRAMLSVGLGLAVATSAVAQPTRPAPRAIRRRTNPVFPVQLVRAIRMPPRDRKFPISAGRRSLPSRTDKLPFRLGPRACQLLKPVEENETPVSMR